MKSLITKNRKYYCRDRVEMIEFIPDEARFILEIGCGEGCFSQLIKKTLKAEVWGIELDAKAYELARLNLDRVLCGDINNLLPELPDEYFDCIIFNDVIEHLVDPFDTLEKIKSKLKKGGKVIASIPNMRYTRALFSLVVLKDWKYEKEGICDYTHLRFFTEKSIKRMFTQCGYNIQTKGINSTKKLIFHVVNILTLGIFNDCRYIQFACVAQKKD
jgi:2-polyprenyl-3-methyl-5-hydroxy-6-metoxy-1,4-benzoquinol methylase